MDDVIVIQLRRYKETDIFGHAVFSIIGIRKPNWLDSLLFTIKRKWYGRVTDKKPEIFKIESLPTKLACSLEVYPGEDVQDIIWKNEVAKQLDYSR